MSFQISENKKVLYRNLAVVAVPIALQSLIASSLNLIDNLMVGAMGEADGYGNVYIYSSCIFLFFLPPLYISLKIVIIINNEVATFKERAKLEYVIGALAGLAAGCLIGYLKNVFIWKGYVNKEDGTSDHEQAQVYSRALISYFVNIIALVVVFLVRNYLPFSWIACIVALATGMALMNIVTAARRK